MNPTLDPAKFLDDALAAFACQTGTIHRTGPDGMLDLVVQRGVPDALMDKIAKIPFGKGIAGAAAERREPVELCNLQADLEGVAKPDARQTGVSGSLAVPILSKNDGSVLGTLGVGMFQPHEFSAAETSRLQSLAADLAAAWES
jgi:signal transduction protein with GAF and PtsI domain